MVKNIGCSKFRKIGCPLLALKGCVYIHIFYSYTFSFLNQDSVVLDCRAACCRMENALGTCWDKGALVVETGCFWREMGPVEVGNGGKLIKCQCRVVRE